MPGITDNFVPEAKIIGRVSYALPLATASYSCPRTHFLCHSYTHIHALFETTHALSVSARAFFTTTVTHALSVTTHPLSITPNAFFVPTHALSITTHAFFVPTHALSITPHAFFVPYVRTFYNHAHTSHNPAHIFYNHAHTNFTQPRTHTQNKMDSSRKNTHKDYLLTAVNVVGGRGIR